MLLHSVVVTRLDFLVELWLSLEMNAMSDNINPHLVNIDIAELERRFADYFLTVIDALLHPPNKAETSECNTPSTRAWLQHCYSVSSSSDTFEIRAKSEITD